MRIVLILFVSLILSACDRRECISGHVEPYTYTQPVLIGMIGGVPNYMYLPVESTRWVCDVYKE